MTATTFVAREIDYDYFVYGNCVLQIFLPQSLLSLMDGAYSTKLNLFQKVADLFAMTFKEFSINIVITRNAALARAHKERVEQFLSG